MITGQLSPSTIQEPAFANAVWQEVFEWFENLHQDNPDGERLIRDHEIYANFMTAETQPREKLLMEAHKKFIDLHYCIWGGEKIEWAPTKLLTIQKEYDHKTDATLYNPSKTVDSIIVAAGKFAIFFPDEAHMPKIYNDTNKLVKKVVIKIKADLLFSNQI
jgi:YhcH/YjgK/YiaL family protein